ncbi:DUF4139 domain-containing protein [Dokdonia sp.]|uniref:DUF4139 domain-containing protein n=1 Tax=Dokdonia sp. TaxID=2024995 RepID=UPI003264C856
MKKVFLLIAFLIANYAFAKSLPAVGMAYTETSEIPSTVPKSVASNISLVTVYLNGAQVERAANVLISEGTTTFMIDNLSNTIDENSIQVSGLNDATILSINYSINHLTKHKNTEAVEALQKEKKAIVFSIKKLNNLMTGLHKEEEVITLNQKLGSTTQEVSLEKVKALATYYRERITAIKNALLDAELKRAELQQQNQDLTKQLNELNITEEKSTGQITLKVYSDLKTSLQLNVSYNVRNAGWYPLYDLKAKTINTPLALSYKAHIHQNTGSNWDDVKLVISTGDPNTNNLKPELGPKYLNFINNYYRSKQKKALGYATTEVQLEDITNTLEGKARGVDVDYTSTGDIKTEGITTTRFEIKKQYSIPSDGDITVIEVDTFEIPATYEYFAAPILNENVFLTASITDWTKYSLLPGEANIYFEGSFSGKTFIDPLTTTEELTISLGVDQGVIIKREQLDNIKATSFIGSQRIIDNSYTIEIKNNKKIAINLKLLDRIPKSQNKEIKVDDIETGDANYKTKTGLLEWNLNITPNSTQEKSFSYELRYPKEKRINL